MHKIWGSFSYCFRRNLQESPFSKGFLTCTSTFPWRNCTGHLTHKLQQWRCCSRVHLKLSFTFKFKMRWFSLPAHSYQLVSFLECGPFPSLGEGNFHFSKRWDTTTTTTPTPVYPLATLYSLSENKKNKTQNQNANLFGPFVHSVALFIYWTCPNLPFLAGAGTRH